MVRAHTRPIPIRFDAQVRSRLIRAARRMGSNPSAVIRFAVLQQLPQIEAGIIVLTPQSPAKAIAS